MLFLCWENVPPLFFNSLYNTIHEVNRWQSKCYLPQYGCGRWWAGDKRIKGAASNANASPIDRQCRWAQQADIIIHVRTWAFGADYGRLNRHDTTGWRPDKRGLPALLQMSVAISDANAAEQLCFDDEPTSAWFGGFLCRCVTTETDWGGTCPYKNER